jgi:putative SOS response-associated peptidase YedK
MLIIGQIGDTESFERYFECSFNEEFKKDWNIHPEKESFAVLSEKPHSLQKVKYGLIPFWSKTRKLYSEAPIDGGVPFDAEKVVKVRIIQDPAFRMPIREKRCLIPADYFILVEEGKSMLFFNQDRSPLSLAGVYDSWKPSINTKETYTGFSVLTFPAAGIFKSFGFEIMPFILPERKFKRWMKDSLHLVEVTQMIEPLDEKLLNAYEVDSRKILQGINERDVTFPTSELLKPLKENNFGITSARILRSHRYIKGAARNFKDQEPKIWSQ